jgi:hypothetical protein
MAVETSTMAIIAVVIVASVYVYRYLPLAPYSYMNAPGFD